MWRGIETPFAVGGLARAGARNGREGEQGTMRPASSGNSGLYGARDRNAPVLESMATPLEAFPVSLPSVVSDVQIHPVVTVAVLFAVSIDPQSSLLETYLRNPNSIPLTRSSARSPRKAVLALSEAVETPVTQSYRAVGQRITSHSGAVPWGRRPPGRRC